MAPHQSASDDRGGGPASPGGPRPPRLIAGRFEVVDLLGEGPAGKVFRVRDHGAEAGLRRLKILRAEALDGEGAEERAAERVTRLCSFGNEHVARLFDAGRTDLGLFFLVGEYAAGETLRARLDRKGALHPREALEIARQILRGLEAGHREHLVHGGVEPENVLLLDRGPWSQDNPFAIRVLLLDFGLTARSWGAEDAPDVRGDLATVGALLCSMLAGDRADGDLPPFSPEVTALFDLARGGRVGERFEGAAALRGAIEETLAEPPPTAIGPRRATAAEPAAEPLFPAVLPARGGYVLSIAFAILAASALYLWWQGRGPSQGERELRAVRAELTAERDRSARLVEELEHLGEAGGGQRDDGARAAAFQEALADYEREKAALAAEAATWSERARGAEEAAERARRELEAGRGEDRRPSATAERPRPGAEAGEAAPGARDPVAEPEPPGARPRPATEEEPAPVSLERRWSSLLAASPDRDPGEVLPVAAALGPKYVDAALRRYADFLRSAAESGGRLDLHALRTVESLDAWAELATSDDAFGEDPARADIALFRFARSWLEGSADDPPPDHPVSLGPQGGSRAPRGWRDELALRARLLRSDSAWPGPSGSRFLYRIAEAAGGNGPRIRWQLDSVSEDPHAPRDVVRAWTIDQRFFDVEGRPLERRSLRLVQRGRRILEEGPMAVVLLEVTADDETISFAAWEPAGLPLPPARIPLDAEALAAFRAAVDQGPWGSLVARQGATTTWYSPDWGVVRYENPGRLTRVLAFAEIPRDGP